MSADSVLLSPEQLAKIRRKLDLYFYSDLAAGDIAALLSHCTALSARCEALEQDAARTVEELHEEAMAAVDRGDLRTALLLSTRALTRAVEVETSYATITVLLKQARNLAQARNDGASFARLAARASRSPVAPRPEP